MGTNEFLSEGEKAHVVYFTPGETIEFPDSVDRKSQGPQTYPLTVSFSGTLANVAEEDLPDRLRDLANGPYSEGSPSDNGELKKAIYDRITHEELSGLLPLPQVFVEGTSPVYAPVGSLSCSYGEIMAIEQGEAVIRMMPFKASLEVKVTTKRFEGNLGFL